MLCGFLIEIPQMGTIDFFLNKRNVSKNHLKTHAMKTEFLSVGVGTALPAVVIIIFVIGALCAIGYLVRDWQKKKRILAQTFQVPRTIDRSDYGAYFVVQDVQEDKILLENAVFLSDEKVLYDKQKECYSKISTLFGINLFYAMKHTVPIKLVHPTGEKAWYVNPFVATQSIAVKAVVKIESFGVYLCNPKEECIPVDHPKLLFS